MHNLQDADGHAAAAAVMARIEVCPANGKDRIGNRRLRTVSAVAGLTNRARLGAAWPVTHNLKERGRQSGSNSLACQRGSQEANEFHLISVAEGLRQRHDLH